MQYIVNLWSRLSEITSDQWLVALWSVALLVIVAWELASRLRCTSPSIAVTRGPESRNVFIAVWGFLNTSQAVTIGAASAGHTVFLTSVNTALLTYLCFFAPRFTNWLLGVRARWEQRTFQL